MPEINSSAEKRFKQCASTPLRCRYKARKLLQRAYRYFVPPLRCQRLTGRKKDIANKIVHELLEHEHVYMQDENLSGWQKCLFGRTVQHSLVKAKLIKHERVTALSRREATTKYCPMCGKLKRDITLADRIYECTCGYREDRDIHAARNMILLAKKHTCGTQEINAFGEDVQRTSCKTLAEHHEAASMNYCVRYTTGSPRFSWSASHKRG